MTLPETPYRMLRVACALGGLLSLASLASGGANLIPPSGFVGIGTTNPEFLLHVVADGAYHYDSQNVAELRSSDSSTTLQAAQSNFSLKNSNTTDNNWARMAFQTSDSNNQNAQGAFIGAQFKSHSAGAVTSDLVLGTKPTGNSQQERVRITGAGNVGIGTSSPSALLHVAGDVQVDGNLAAKYQDVAEWVQARNLLPAGVVVVVDSERRNQIVPASAPYDTRVAGVVSARPGLLLGEDGENKVKVAHSGRVKVKVDAHYGAISTGDLLVSSPTPGHAMRSEPIDVGAAKLHRPGTLIGKALEPLENGQGEILVLLTLQ